MQPEKSALRQSVRRLCLITGFISFMLFAYKATHEVSSFKIAAGGQRINTETMVSAPAPAIQPPPGDALYALNAINSVTPQTASNAETLAKGHAEPEEPLTPSDKTQSKDKNLPAKLAMAQPKGPKR